MGPGGAMVLLGLLSSAGAGNATVVFRPQAAVASAQVRLGDIADVSALPNDLRGPAARLPIAAFRTNQTRLEFSSVRAVERARALMPGLSPWLANSREMVISVAFTGVRQTRSAQSGSCIKVINRLALDSIPTATDFAPSDCKDEVAGRVFRYDAKSGVVKTARDFRVGEILPAATQYAFAAVRPGQRLYVGAHIGVVTVQREVEAVQPARPGRALFVRAADGTVFSAPSPVAVQ